MKAMHSGVLAAVLIAAAALPTASVRAESNTTFYSTNGGYACKPGNGVFTNFSFGTTLVRNVSASDQVLICNLPQIRPTVVNFPLGTSGYEVRLLFANTNNVPTTVTCTVTVSYAGMLAGNVSTATKQVTIAPGAGGALLYTKEELVINDEFAPVNVSCVMPSKSAFGRVDQTMP